MFAIRLSRALWLSLVLAAALIFAVLPLCRADDASVQGVGGAVEMIGQHPTIRMVSENVTITNPENPHVTARFVFHNDGPATTVLIGFPERAYGAEADAKNAGLANFHSLVDGLPIKVTEKPDGENVADSGDYEGWLVKSVHFGAHQTHVITDTYEGGGGEDAIGTTFFEYILQSGASWKGPIGRAVITADLSPLAGYSPYMITPSGYKLVGHKAIWDMRNFKPKDDIQVTWFPGFIDVDVNGQYPYSGMDHQVRPEDTSYWRADTSISRVFWPIKRGNDLWLPAKTVAEWLGGRYAVEKPGQVVRVELGKQWVEARLDSRILRRSDGKTFTMSEPASYLHNPDDRTQAMTMIDLTPLVRAFGGTARFTAGGTHMSVTVQTSNGT